jgi:hypothetical protein
VDARKSGLVVAQEAWNRYTHHVGVPGVEISWKLLETLDLFGSFDADVCAYGCKEVGCSQIGNRHKGRCFFAENV